MAVPAGPISLSLDNLANTLADSENFRTFVGAADRAAALAKIHVGALPRPGTPPAFEHREYTEAEITALRPYALIWVDEAGGGLVSTKVAAGTFVQSGRIKCQLIQNVAAGIADDLPEVDLVFNNSIGEIIDDLYALVALGVTATYSYLAAIDRIVTDAGPSRLDAESEAGMGDAQGVELGIEWGEGDA